MAAGDIQLKLNIKPGNTASVLQQIQGRFAALGRTVNASQRQSQMMMRQQGTAAARFGVIGAGMREMMAPIAGYVGFNQLKTALEDVFNKVQMINREIREFQDTVAGPISLIPPDKLNLSGIMKEKEYILELEKAYGKLGDKAKEMSNFRYQLTSGTFGIVPDKTIAGSGTDEEKRLKTVDVMTRKTLELSKATGGDYTQAIDLMLKTWHTFSGQFKSINDMTNKLLFSQREAYLNFGEMATEIPRMAPAASALGYNFNQVMSSIISGSQRTGHAEELFIGMQNIIITLEDMIQQGYKLSPVDNKDLLYDFKLLNQHVKTDRANMAKRFGKRQFTVMTALTSDESLKRMEEMIKQMEQLEKNHDKLNLTGLILSTKFQDPTYAFKRRLDLLEKGIEIINLDASRYQPREASFLNSFTASQYQWIKDRPRDSIGNYFQLWLAEKLPFIPYLHYTGSEKNREKLRASELDLAKGDPILEKYIKNQQLFHKAEGIASSGNLDLTSMIKPTMDSAGDVLLDTLMMVVGGKFTNFIKGGVNKLRTHTLKNLRTRTDDNFTIINYLNKQYSRLYTDIAKKLDDKGSYEFLIGPKTLKQISEGIPGISEGVDNLPAKVLSISEGQLYSGTNKLLKKNMSNIFNNASAKTTTQLIKPLNTLSKTEIQALLKFPKQYNTWLKRVSKRTENIIDQYNAIEFIAKNIGYLDYIAMAIAVKIKNGILNKPKKIESSSLIPNINLDTLRRWKTDNYGPKQFDPTKKPKPNISLYFKKMEHEFLKKIEAVDNYTQNMFKLITEKYFSRAVSYASSIIPGVGAGKKMAHHLQGAGISRTSATRTYLDAYDQQGLSLAGGLAENITKGVEPEDINNYTKYMRDELLKEREWLKLELDRYIEIEDMQRDKKNAVLKIAQDFREPKESRHLRGRSLQAIFVTDREIQNKKFELEAKLKTNLLKTNAYLDVNYAVLFNRSVMLNNEMTKMADMADGINKAIELDKKKLDIEEVIKAKWNFNNHKENHENSLKQNISKLDEMAAIGREYENTIREFGKVLWAGAEKQLVPFVTTLRDKYELAEHNKKIKEYTDVLTRLGARKRYIKPGPKKPVNMQEVEKIMKNYSNRPRSQASIRERLYNNNQPEYIDDAWLYKTRREYTMQQLKDRRNKQILEYQKRTTTFHNKIRHNVDELRASKGLKPTIWFPNATPPARRELSTEPIEPKGPRKRLPSAYLAVNKFKQNIYDVFQGKGPGEDQGSILSNFISSTMNINQNRNRIYKDNKWRYHEPKTKPLTRGGIPLNTSQKLLTGLSMGLGIMTGGHGMMEAAMSSGMINTITKQPGRYKNIIPDTTTPGRYKERMAQGYQDLIDAENAKFMEKRQKIEEAAKKAADEKKKQEEEALKKHEEYQKNMGKNIAEQTDIQRKQLERLDIIAKMFGDGSIAKYLNTLMGGQPTTTRTPATGGVHQPIPNPAGAVT